MWIQLRQTCHFIEWVLEELVRHRIYTVVITQVVLMKDIMKLVLVNKHRTYIPKDGKKFYTKKYSNLRKSLTHSKYNYNLFFYTN